MYQSGNQQVNPPMVKANRPYCSCFTPLPADTTTNAKGKVDADTPGDAAKQAYEAKHIPVTFAAEKKPAPVCLDCGTRLAPFPRADAIEGLVWCPDDGCHNEDVYRRDRFDWTAKGDES